MKNRLFIVILLSLCFCLSLFGCGKPQTAALPDLGIDWDMILPRITEEKLSEYGLYADMTALTEDAEDFGSVTFCNYDLSVKDSFKKVDYQLTVEYGLDFEFQNGKTEYYDSPVYTVDIIDNRSGSYYSCTCSEDFELIGEEGEWFLTENKDEFLFTLLADCKDILFGN